MKDVQELDIYVHPSSLMHNYWLALCLVLVTAGGGVLALIACWYRKCSFAKVHERRNRGERLTGHDRFGGAKAEGGRKRRGGGVRESKSANELSRRVPEGSPLRSASYEQVRGVGAPPGGKWESLVRLFSCVAGGREEQGMRRQGNGSYAYTALEPGSNPHERLELQTKPCERAHAICSAYLRSNPRYTLLHQLNHIGSRLGKHWFVVRDASVKTERLLTLVPLAPACPIPCDPESRSVILDLFLALQHPYIYPVLDVNFRTLGARTFIFVTLPLNDSGSLKDFIYKSRWRDNWGHKYFQRGLGLPLSQIQRLGRQILEALLFLRERGFPPCGHFHTGNIVLQNGVARLTGLDNALFGFRSRIHPLLLSRALSEPAAVDSLCFGHVLFEMCAGYELNAPQPSPGNLLDILHPQVVDVLEFIFDHPDMRLPTIEELLLCDLFRNIDLREIRNQAQSTQVFKTNLTPRALDLLDEVKRAQGAREGLRVEAPFEADWHRDRSTSSAGSEDEVDDGDYDADTNTESENSRKKFQEHRSLSLHANASNNVLISVRRKCDG